MKINQPVTNNRQLFNEALISTTDLKGIITSANSGFIKVSGYSEEELIGRNHNIVRHPDMPPAAFGDLWDTLKNDSPWMGIVKNRCKNGDYYWVDAYVAPIIKDGQTLGYQSVRAIPRDDDVARAESLYKHINKGKKLRKGWFDISFFWQLFTSHALLAIVMVLASMLLGALSLSNTLMLVLLSLVASWLLATISFRPIASIFKKLNMSLPNTLIRKVYAGRMDEVGALLTLVKFLEAKVRTMTGRVGLYSGKFSEQAKKANAVSLVVGNAMQNQRAEIEQVATAINEMVSTVEEVAKITSSTSNESESADKAAKDGALGASAALGGIENVMTKLNNASEVIQELSNESNSIGSVLDVIRGISEQTNLLALNAAIEAARAGEAGRGFAVVADEVRTLASKTGSSTDEIQSMIERLQSKVKEAVHVMEESVSAATEGSVQVENSAERMAEISQSITEISDLNIQIANSTEEQACVSNEINKNISRITEVMHDVEESAIQAAESSKSMTEMADELGILIRQCSV
jgi:aerotaxis receptor